MDTFVIEGRALATLLLPFIGALWIAVAPQRHAKVLCSLFALLATLGMAWLAWSWYAAGQQDTVVTLYRYGDAALFGFVFDRVSLLIGFAVVFLGLLVSIYSCGYLTLCNREHPHQGTNRYYAFLLVFIGAMAGLTLSSTLLGQLLFFEITGGCSWALIGYYQQPKPLRSALKALLVTHVASIGLYLATAWLFAKTGTFALSAISQLDSADKMVVFAGIMFAAWGKSAQWPLHVWLPDAMEAPTPVSAYLHAASMVKVGIYIFARAILATDDIPRVPAAVWGEREVRDMYGLIPVGLPDERRLVLPDDWPDDLYPLRKDAMDYRQRPAPTQDNETYSFVNDATGDTRVVPIGPLHITSDEPGHFRLFVDGEQIIDADYRLFYVHRGMEKLAETRMGYNEVIFLSDRVCGICGFTHSVAYTTSIENAMGIVVPPRAHAIRSILLEVERLHSHLLNIGLSSHFVGFDTGFMQFFRIREKSMTIAEILTGARKTYGLNLIGGIRRDILKEDRLKTIKLIREMRTEIMQLSDMLLNTPNMLQRTQGIGILSSQVARDYSPVGPMIRASGFQRDMRIDHPYSAYLDLPMELHHLSAGDVYSRVLVRIREVLTSLAIVEYGLDNLPEGPLLTEGFAYKPYQFALGYAEAPRGEDVHWSMTGDNQKLFRWRCRAATYANWPVLRYMLRGNTVSDAPLIIGSLDPCYSCTDRVTLIDVLKQKITTVPYKEIERYGLERTRSPLK